MEREVKSFIDEADFCTYLALHQDEQNGFFIRFDKLKTTSSLTPEQALTNALSYGWIDGLIKKLDDQFYVKYFAPRNKHSIWSTKNKRLAEILISQNKMKARGLFEVNRAKKDGRWERADALPSDFSLEHFDALIQVDALAYQNFLQMSPSVQKTYAFSYFALKTDEARRRRLSVILERLRSHLKPM